MYGFSNVFCICQNIYCTTSKPHIILLEIGYVVTTRKTEKTSRAKRLFFHEALQSIILQTARKKSGWKTGCHKPEQGRLVEINQRKKCRGGR
jgi:hypothetical protein